MTSKFSNIFLITVMILGLIFSPLALTEFTFAEEHEPEDVGKPEDKTKPEGVGKPEDKTKPEGVGKSEDKAAKLADKLQRKEAKLAQPIEDRQAKGLQKSKEIKEQLLQKIDQLKPNQKALLKKVESGEYLGPTLGGDSYTGTYTLVFAMDKVTATAIGNSDEIDTVVGHIDMKNVVTRSNNLKLEVIGCDLYVDVEYYCAFGKARQTSSGPGGDKYSMVIIAFLQDIDSLEKLGTIKIFLNTKTPLNKLGDGDSVDVVIRAPQSRIGHQWFIGGDAKITVSGYTVHETSSIVSSDKVEEPEVEAPEVEPEVEAPEVEPEVEAPEVEPEVEAPEVEPEVEAP